MDLQIQTREATIQKIFELASELAPNDQRVLIDLLSRQIGDSLPEKATVDEAISLYLSDKCSLARAAELANLSRWELIDVLKSRDIPITIEAEFTVAEMDDIERELEREGLVCS
jgi:predicted HTH domain antitoxin